MYPKTEIMERKLSEKNYIAIADWMVTDLNLNSRELLTYAIIYGFSQDGESCFSGSLSYLAAWLNVSDRNNVRRTLNSLINKRLIEKQTIKLNDRQTGCLYRVTSSKGETKLYDHIFISPWMINTLNLKDRELILYALIYGFSRLGSTSYCQASTEYMGKWIGVQKNHVKERYLNRLIKDGYVLAIESSTENTKYQAIVPDNVFAGSDSQNDHTSPKTGNDAEVSQNDHIPSHFNHTSNPRSTTPNKDNLENNLEDNLLSFNNNSNSNNASFDSKESLSVVVNEKINTDDFYLDLEKEAFTFMEQLEFDIYKKYKNRESEVDILLLLKKQSLYLFRMLLGEWPAEEIKYQNMEALLFSTIFNRRFNERAELINSLSEEEVGSLFMKVYDLYNPEQPVDIRRSKEAYMIGVMENVLDVKRTD